MSEINTPPAVAPNDRKFVFVCGAPRSGTTALTALLNRHPHIFIGVERYKKLPRQEFGPELFHQDRFFDAREGDTNNKFVKNDKVLAKYAEALWVGDKVPRYYAIYNLLLEKFPNCKMIYIQRELDGVASSWDKRAKDPADRWPLENDYRRAVAEWNLAIAKTLQFQKKHPSQFIIVNYEDLFSGNTLVLRRILKKLNLQLPKQMLRVFVKMTSDWNKRVKDKDVSERGQYLDAHADMENYRRLKALAISPLPPSSKAES